MISRPVTVADSVVWSDRPSAFVVGIGFVLRFGAAQRTILPQCAHVGKSIFVTTLSAFLRKNPKSDGVRRFEPSVRHRPVGWLQTANPNENGPAWGVLRRFDFCNFNGVMDKGTFPARGPGLRVSRVPRGRKARKLAVWQPGCGGWHGLQRLSGGRVSLRSCCHDSFF